MKERRIGSYVACTYSKETTNLLFQWMNIWNIPNPIAEVDMHSTILYSRVELPLSARINYDSNKMSQLVWKFSPTKIELLKSRDGPSALVIIIDAPELVRVHEDLKAAGGTHDFPSLLTHVTVSYDIPDSFDISKIQPPPVYLIPNKIYTEPLDCNWEK